MAIQQHPLPQDISSYRFRLIGDMTIKQFASLAISIIVAIFVYSLPLPFFFKYPLSFIFVVLGIGMAFVPLQGRTLDVWIIAFIKSIYSPTLFSWKKTPIEEVTPDTVAQTDANSQSAPSVSNAEIQIIKNSPIAPVQPVSVATPPAQTTSTPPEIPITKTENINVSPSVEIPKTETTPIIPPIPVIAKSPEATVAIPDSTIAPTVVPPTPQAVPASSNLPIPFTPTTPNTLVGLTISQDNHIIDGVLVEIKKNGQTIRATKSNKLGQFMFARPLDNGVFQILAEKEGLTFAQYSLELTGEIIRPLKIQSQS